MCLNHPQLQNRPVPALVVVASAKHQTELAVAFPVSQPWWRLRFQIVGARRECHSVQSYLLLVSISLTSFMYVQICTVFVIWLYFKLTKYITWNNDLGYKKGDTCISRFQYCSLVLIDCDCPLRLYVND